jgi:hypothetical protein
VLSALRQKGVTMAVAYRLFGAQIQKVDVNYNKTSKQVDVRILKESLWSRLQHIQAANDIVSIVL